MHKSATSFKSRMNAEKSGSLVPRQPRQSSHRATVPSNLLQRALGNQYLSSQHLQNLSIDKHNISQPDDEYEQEAERVAERIMHMPDVSKLPDSVANTQHDKTEVEKQLDEEEPQLKPLETQMSPPAAPDEPDDNGSNGSNNNGSNSNGEPLPVLIRQFFEPRFASNFNQVRIHTNHQANVFAASINAKAYTSGNNIVFGKGYFQPESYTGKHLLAHELTHVIQQNPKGSYSSKPGLNSISPLSTPTLQRDPEEQTDPDPVREILTELARYYVDDADAVGDSDYIAWATRVNLIVQLADLPEFEDDDQIEEWFDDFVLGWASDEAETRQAIKDSDHFWLDGMPDVFPETWAELVYDALAFDINIDDLVDDAKKINENLQDVLEDSPEKILKVGLPITFESALEIETFRLTFAYARLRKDHIIKDIALQGIKYTRALWASGFFVGWNGMAESIRDSISSGEYIVDPETYYFFIENHEELKEAIPQRLKQAYTQKNFDAINNDVLNISNADLVLALSGTLTSLLGILIGWKRSQEGFNKALLKTDKLIIALDEYERVATAMNWAWENGYYGDSGQEIFDSLLNNLPWIILAVIGFIVVQYIPYLNVAVDVALLVYSGIDLIFALDALKTAFDFATKVKTVEQMQQASAKIASAMTADGLRAILDLVGIAASLKVLKVKAAKIQKAEGLTAEQAMMRAIAEESGTPIGLIDDAVKFLKVNKNSQAARYALRYTLGHVEQAEVMVKVFNGNLSLSKAELLILKQTSPSYFSSYKAMQAVHTAGEDFSILQRLLINESLIELHRLNLANSIKTISKDSANASHLLETLKFMEITGLNAEAMYARLMPVLDKSITIEKLLVQVKGAMRLHFAEQAHGIYAGMLDEAVQVTKDVFSGLGKVDGRAKNPESAANRLSRAVEEGWTPEITSTTAAIDNLWDAIGTRLVLTDASPTAIDKVVSRLVTAMETGEMEVTMVNRLAGEGGRHYFTKAHLEQLENAGEAVGSNIKVGTKTYETGYTVVTVFLKYANGVRGELQIIGREALAIANAEHLPYDAILGKPHYLGQYPKAARPEVSRLVGKIEKAATNLDEAGQAKYYDYLNQSYIKAREAEIGSEVGSAALPEGISKVLSVENLIAVEKRLSELKKK